MEEEDRSGLLLPSEYLARNASILQDASADRSAAVTRNVPRRHFRQVADSVQVCRPKTTKKRLFRQAYAKMVVQWSRPCLCSSPDKRGSTEPSLRYPRAAEGTQRISTLRRRVSVRTGTEPPQIDALQTHVLSLHAASASDSLSGTCHRLLPVDVANPPDRMTCLQWSSLNTVFSGNAAGHFLRNWTNGRRHDQAADEQGLRVYRHRERQGPVFSLVRPGRGELRRTPRRTTSVIQRRTWTERTEGRKRQAGLTELRGTFVFSHGETSKGKTEAEERGEEQEQVTSNCPTLSGDCRSNDEAVCRTPQETFPPVMATGVVGSMAGWGLESLSLVLAANRMFA